ncbi:FAD-binding oxidoreductase [Heyndrickxia sporothermodurans]|nr:FAD-binding oxidoreductase [Heyndrickxia sporothermodurans]MED3652569.1 FAD-binding oxidoreductase [Heyndrickxia sporothermodurans]MED3655715.1 FAD-binding oxidoreductase [Heyndrickxia sporothermodurans]MED3698503.1 FAD-binding oxidoreductase [Heyndrickxia sporothermodurans]MED3780557.1 FAD-binding oxidoreductase [Heyndrickxia sporothermodurans]
MSKMEKIIIVGAGILGASTAYHLAKAGTEVIVIDKNDEGQATDAAAGIVCPWLSQRRNKAWYKLAKGGAKYYPTLIASLERDGETDTGYARVGAISIHTDTEKLSAMEKRAIKRKVDAPEIGEITVLNHEQTKALFPPLADGYSSVHVSGAARVNGRALRSALLRGATKHGAVIISGNASLLCKEKEVTGVIVDKKEITANKVIVTAGAWANQIIEPLGIQFQVTSQKAQIMHLQIPNESTSNWPVVIPPSDQYILSFEDQRIVIGATHENNVGFDTRVTAGGCYEILNKALQIAPGLADCSILETRVGFRPFTPDFLPVIGPLPGVSGILVANGLGASGLTMGPFIGLQLAKLALGKELDIELSHYDVASAVCK